MKDKEIQQIREDFQKYIDQLNEQYAEKGINKKVSINSCARGIGVSGATLSLFLKGTYKGNNEHVASQVKNWLQREAERSEMQQVPTSIVETKALQKLNRIARLCHLEGEIGVATGEAGNGKTVSLKHYAKQHSDVILLEVDPGYTAKNMISEVHRKLGLDGRGTIYDMFQDIIERMKGSGRMIIVDEAENLPHRALELLRRLHDKAEIGILLAGMPRLLMNLRGNKGEFKQLYSRVGVKATISDLDNEDISAIVSNSLPNSNGLYKEFARRTQNARVLDKLLKRSIQIADHNGLDEVDRDVVEAAVNHIMI